MTIRRMMFVVAMIAVDLAVVVPAVSRCYDSFDTRAKGWPDPGWYAVFEVASIRVVYQDTKGRGKWVEWQTNGGTTVLWRRTAEIEAPESRRPDRHARRGL